MFVASQAALSHRQRAALPAREGLLRDHAADAAAACRTSKGLDVGHLYESSRASTSAVTSTTFFARGGRLAVFLGDVTEGNRSGRRHGDGEVQLPRSRASGSTIAVPRERQRGHRRRDRDRQVHHDALPARRSSRAQDRARARHASAPRIVAPGGKSPRSTPAALRWGSSRTRVRDREDRARARFHRRPVHGRRHRGAPRRRASGEERLDKALRKHRKLDAQALAEAILVDCRTFAGGELDDDCAIVCLKLAATES